MGFDMADEAPKAADKAVAAKAGPAPMVLIGAAVGALLAGAAVGNFVLAPRLAAGKGAPKAAAAHQAEKGGHGEKGEAKGSFHKLENMIINAAGSQGTRFLMASVTIEVPDDKAEGALRARDAETRDLVQAILESQSLEMLTRPGARDAIKQKIAAALMPIAGKPAWVHVYLPQFVIQ